MDAKLTPQMHGTTKTLCDGQYAYYDHNDKLVRQHLEDDSKIQGYRGNNQWADLPAGWGQNTNFLMPGGETTPLYDPAEADQMMKSRDAAAN